MTDKSHAFEFIPVSGKNIKGDAATRKRVRSRAQADYRRKNPPAPRPALRHDLDVREWLQVVSRDTKNFDSGRIILANAERQRATSGGHGVSRPLSPFDRKGADIFELMGPAERKRAQVLWQHLYGGTCVVFKSMVEIGFLHLLRGSAALTQMLSSSAWHMNNEARGNPESTVEYARYSVMATKSLCHMLSEPSKRVTVETIMAILTFAAYANLTSDPKLVNIHLDGLCHALSYVGGLQAIDNLPVLRTMIYWIDLRASFLQDVKPRFPQPMAILSQRSEIVPRQVIGPLAQLPDNAQVSLVCEGIESINIVINYHLETEGDAIWGNVLFPQFHLAPLLHDLLTMARTSATDSASAHSRELLRLATILYLCKLWARFGMDMTGDAFYVTKLRLLLTMHDFPGSWCLDSGLLRWVLLVICTYERAPSEARREWNLLLQQEAALYPSTNDYLVTIPRGLWCESALGPLGPILQRNGAATCSPICRIPATVKGPESPDLTHIRLLIPSSTEACCHGIRHRGGPLGTAIVVQILHNTPSLTYDSP